MTAVSPLLTQYRWFSAILQYLHYKHSGDSSVALSHWRTPGGRLNIKMLSYQYRDGNPHTWKDCLSIETGPWYLHSPCHWGCSPVLPASLPCCPWETPAWPGGLPPAPSYSMGLGRDPYTVWCGVVTETSGQLGGSWSVQMMIHTCSLIKENAFENVIWKMVAILSEHMGHAVWFTPIPQDHFTSNHMTAPMPVIQ